MKHIIVVISGNTLETWGCLTEACEAHEKFSYAYLKGKKFPFTYKGCQFKKVPYRKASISM